MVARLLSVAPLQLQPQVRGPRSRREPLGGAAASLVRSRGRRRLRRGRRRRLVLVGRVEVHVVVCEQVRDAFGFCERGCGSRRLRWVWRSFFFVLFFFFFLSFGLPVLLFCLSCPCGAAAAASAKLAPDHLDRAALVQVVLAHRRALLAERPARVQQRHVTGGHAPPVSFLEHPLDLCDRHFVLQYHVCPAASREPEQDFELVGRLFRRGAGLRLGPHVDRALLVDVVVAHPIACLAEQPAVANQPPALGVEGVRGAPLELLLDLCNRHLGAELQCRYCARVHFEVDGERFGPRLGWRSVVRRSKRRLARRSAGGAGGAVFAASGGGAGPGGSGACRRG